MRDWPWVGVGLWFEVGLCVGVGRWVEVGLHIMQTGTHGEHITKLFKMLILLIFICLMHGN